MKNTKRVLAFLVGAAMMLPMASAEGKLASGNYRRPVRASAAR